MSVSPAKAATGAAAPVCPHFHTAIELIGRRWTGAIVCALTELGPAIDELRDWARRWNGA